MVKANTKTAILVHLRSLTDTFTFENVGALTAVEISKSLYISRSLASQYLNELVKDEVLLKTNSRPVYFFHCGTLKKRFNLQQIDEEFYSIEELQQFIARNGKAGHVYDRLVGFDKSLSVLITHLQESIEYPPVGLPVQLTGPAGAGKRAIAQAVAEDSAQRRGGPRQDARIEQLNAAQKDFDALVFAQDGLLRSGKPLLLIVVDAHKLTIQQQDQFCDYLSASPRRDGARAGIIFLTVTGKNAAFQERMGKSVPITIQVPGLKERSYDEREELVMHFLKEEAARLGREIYINSVTLRTLVKADYPGNIRELRSVVKQMCAKVIGRTASREDITLESKDLPEEQLRSLQINTSDQLSYVHVGSYRRNEKTNVLLEYFSNLLACFHSERALDSQMRDAGKIVENLMSRLLYEQQIESAHLLGIEQSLASIVDVVMRRRFMSVPAEFTFMVSKLFYYCDKYPSNIDKWLRDNEAEIQQLNRLLFEKSIDEGMITSEIVDMVKKNLGIDAYDILLTVILIALRKYRQQAGARKYIGLIACHGRSTAASIADAANSLINAYVYDAIDMPLNVSVDQVAQVIVDKLHRLNSRADAIILVDMGSLEHLGEMLSRHVNRRIGVINNVSTRAAVQIGHEILNGSDMERILRSAAEETRLEYTIAERKANSKILFVSESGIQTARRMRDLFRDSLPEDIPVDCEICDFNQLTAQGTAHEMFSDGRVLFISGTSNPLIQGVPYVALEETIDSSDNGVIKNTLGRHLPPEQMEQMLQTLRAKFTLSNIVGHLTILNPQILLENVTRSVERLQTCMGREFKGRTLVGIYIHVCCLVERLVTKNPIQDDQNMERFAAEHGDFIRMVDTCFTNIKNHYGVEIPLNEISYLYDFIAADMERRADASGGEDILEGD